MPVTSVSDGQVTWKHHNGATSKGFSNFIIPALTWTSDNRSSTGRTSAPPKLLWPLALGKRGAFTFDRTITNKTATVKPDNSFSTACGARWCCAPAARMPCSNRFRTACKQSSPAPEPPDCFDRKCGHRSSSQRPLSPCWSSVSVYVLALPLPVYREGTTFVYTNGRWKTVEKVGPEGVTWHNHLGHLSTGSADFTCRHAVWKTRTRSGGRSFRARSDWLGRPDATSVRPLAPGKKASYIESGRWQDDEGKVHTYEYQW